MAKTQSAAIRIAWLPPELNRALASISRALGASVAGELNAVTTGRPSRVAANFLEQHVKDFDHLAERAGRIEGENRTERPLGVMFSRRCQNGAHANRSTRSIINIGEVKNK